jgi:DNA modification methylase
MEVNRIYNESNLQTMARMKDNSIDCVITSPPYWQLRDYGYDGQWGLEPTFQQYLENLWSMMDEIYRVLKPEGTCWINLGDTYMNNSSYCEKGRQGYGNDKIGMLYKSSDTIKQKSLCLIPHRFAIGCIDRCWIMRNDVIWAKRNGMPESVTDRFSKKHEYFFFMVKSEKYFFDLDAIRDKIIYNDDRGRFSDHPNNGGQSKVILNPNGKNPGSVSDFWDIPTKPSSSKHYASYNDSLLVKPVLAGCPEGGIIYDPFMGTGSTAEVALRSNRKFIGSEMSKDYCEIATKRLEPFLLQQTLNF